MGEGRRGTETSWFGKLLGKKNRLDQDSFGRSQGEDEGYKFHGDGGVEVYEIAWLCYCDDPSRDCHKGKVKGNAGE